jgi:hypothetical protein
VIRWPRGCTVSEAQEVIAMIERRTFPTRWDGCEISVVTERLSDGRWAVVANINHKTPERMRTVDLPVPDVTFASEDEAEAYGREQAQHWLDQNMPKSEAA